MKNFHYVYLVEDTKPEKHERFYIGVRSSKVHPEDDPYLGSPSSKLSAYWVKRLKTHPELFKKTILSVHATREDANNEEIRIHDEIDVDQSLEFYNRINATSVGFNPIGKSTYIDPRTNARIWTNTDDPLVVDGTYQHIHKGTIIVFNTCTISFERVPVESINHTHVCASSIHMKQKTIFRHKQTNAPQILPTNDQRVLSGEFVGINKDRSTFKHVTTGEVKNLSKDDPLVLDGTYVGVTTGFCAYKHKDTSDIQYLRIDDPLVLDGTYVGLSDKTTIFKHKITNEYMRLKIDDPLVLDGTYVGINAGVPRNLDKIYISTYVEISTGKIIKTTKNDPRVISKELIIKRLYVG